MDGRIAANKARTRPLGERFEAKYSPMPGGCWRWVGAIGDDGYGNLWVAGQTARAHRVGYELFVGPIPTGLEAHHVCGHRWCVNPNHLVLITRAEHMAVERRKFVCPRGHRKRQAPHGKWVCPTCQAAASRRRYRRKVTG